MSLKSTQLEIPKKIKQSANLIYISLLVGFFKSSLYETMTSLKILSDPKNLAAALVTILLIGFIGYMISQGKNWARIILLVLFILGLVGYPTIVMTEFKISPIIGIVSIIQMLIQLYVLFILFSRETNLWFKHRNSQIF